MDKYRFKSMKVGEVGREYPRRGESVYRARIRVYSACYSACGGTGFFKVKVDLRENCVVYEKIKRIPYKRKYPKANYPFTSMQVGESAFVAMYPGETMNQAQNRACSAAANKLGSGHFTSKRGCGGIIITRIKPGLQ